MKPRESFSIISKLEQAAAHYEDGQLAPAAALTEEILRRYPWHFEALRLGGIIAFRRGDAAAARHLIEKALLINPGKAIAHFDHGNAVRALGLFKEALHSYQRALSLKPNDIDTLNSRGDTLREMGHFAEAVENYEKVLRLQPENIIALAGCGHALHALGRHADAMPKLDKVLTQQPGHLAALRERSQALLRLGQLEAALASYEQLMRHQLPDASMLDDISVIALGLGRYDEALSACDKALQLKPDHALSHCHRGQALLALGNPAESLAASETALRLQPGLVDAQINRGTALTQLARYQDAMECHVRVARIHGQNVLCAWNESLCRLMLGDFEQGWEKYEARWQVAALRRRLPDIAGQRWEPGQRLYGKRILLHHEQGLGDMLQFVRYAPILSAMGAEVVVVAPRPLQRLFTAVHGISRNVPLGEALPPFDLWCPMLSLPRLLGTRLDTIPAVQPYLQAHDNDIRYWRERINRDSAAPGLRVGLAWADGASQDGIPFAMAGKWQPDMPLRLLAPLARLPGTTFYSLQTGDAGKEAKTSDLRLIDHTRMIGNFADMAALVMNLDLVISTDNPVAHLAGALGKPVWLLNGFTGSWRWLDARDDSPWYTVMRVFRQPRPGDWESVVGEVGRELKKRTDSNLSHDMVCA